MADFPDQWPNAKFHFRATIDGEQISFQEISGLDQETEVINYRHGDNPDFRQTVQAGLIKGANIVFKKATFDSDDRLLEIFNRIYDKDFYTQDDSRMEILIELLDEQGDTVMAWNIQRAIPVKLAGTDLNSTGNEVAVETIEFAHEGITTSLTG
jgi:phage tail-like protein